MSSTLSAGPQTEKQTAADELNGPPSAKKRWKEKSATDKSMECMGKYFAARLASLPSQPSATDDENSLFGRVVASELSKMQDVGIKRRLKKSINDLIYAAQEEDDQLQVKRQQQTQLFVVQEDGTLQAIPETELQKM